jgi:hypothetical protein
VENVFAQHRNIPDATRPRLGRFCTPTQTTTSEGGWKKTSYEPRNGEDKPNETKHHPRHFYPVLRIKFFNPDFFLLCRLLLHNTNFSGSLSLTHLCKYAAQRAGAGAQKMQNVRRVKISVCFAFVTSRLSRWSERDFPCN